MPAERPRLQIYLNATVHGYPRICAQSLYKSATSSQICSRITLIVGGISQYCVAPKLCEPLRLTSNRRARFDKQGLLGTFRTVLPRVPDKQIEQRMWLLWT